MNKWQKPQSTKINRKGSDNHVKQRKEGSCPRFKNHSRSSRCQEIQRKEKIIPFSFLTFLFVFSQLNRELSYGLMGCGIWLFVSLFHPARRGVPLSMQMPGEPLASPQQRSPGSLCTSRGSAIASKDSSNKISPVRRLVYCRKISMG